MDLDIEASPAELGRIAEAIQRVEAGQMASSRLEASDCFDPAPYTTALRFIEVKLTSGPTRVAIEADGVFVTGSTQNLQAFASFFESPEGEHMHFEYYDGNPYVSEDSLPAVISARSSSEDAA